MGSSSTDPALAYLGPRSIARPTGGVYSAEIVYSADFANVAAPFALGCYIHGDGHSPFINLFGWFFGTVFLLTCLAGLYLAVASTLLFACGRFHQAGVKAVTGRFLWALPFYILGALAGDLWQVYYMN